MTGSLRLPIAVLAASLTLGGSAFAQSATAPVGTIAPAPAPATVPAVSETGQPGTMGSSQPETTDKVPAVEAGAAAAAVMVPMDKAEAPVQALNLMVGQVDDMDVIGADGNEIGGVGNVLGDQTGKAIAISIDVGGFLGIGDKTVILSLSDLTLDMGRLRTTLTKQQIENLPDFSG